MPSLIVHSCLSQYFVVGGNSVTIETMGGVFSSILVLVMFKTLIMFGCKYGIPTIICIAVHRSYILSYFLVGYV